MMVIGDFDGAPTSAIFALGGENGLFFILDLDRDSDLTRLYKKTILQPQSEQDDQIFINCLVNWVHSASVPYFLCLKQVIRLRSAMFSY